MHFIYYFGRGLLRFLALFLARVKVQGKEIKLRPDGTFSLRFALPDGKQVIPAEATSSDGIDTRRITPIVTRKTE